MEQQIKKSVKIALIFLGIGVLLGSLIVFAATPSATFYISSGVYPGAPSYTVWRESNDYFAKDNTGQIDYSGTNATTVINAALSSGNRVFLQNAEYVIHGTLLIDQNGACLTGESFGIFTDGGVRLLKTDTNLMFNITNAKGILIENLVLIGDSGDQQAFNITSASQSTFRNIGIYHFNATRVFELTYSYYVYIEKVHIEGKFNAVTVCNAMGFYIKNVNRLTMVECGASFVNIGYYLYNDYNINIDGCGAEYANGDSSFGVYVAANCHEITLSNLYLDGCEKQIYISGSTSYPARNIHIENCRFYGFQHTAFGGDYTIYAIEIYAANNTFVENNYFFNASTAYYRLREHAWNTTMISNFYETGVSKIVTVGNPSYNELYEIDP